MITTNSTIVLIASGTLSNQQIDSQTVAQVHQLYSNLLAITSNSLSKIGIYLAIISIFVGIGAVIVPLYMALQVNKMKAESNKRIDQIEERNSKFMLASQESILGLQYQSILNDMQDSMGKKDYMSVLYYLISAIGRSLSISSVTAEIRNGYLDRIPSIIAKIADTKQHIPEELQALLRERFCELMTEAKALPNPHIYQSLMKIMPEFEKMLSVSKAKDE